MTIYNTLELSGVLYHYSSHFQNQSEKERNKIGNCIMLCRTSIIISNVPNSSSICLCEIILLTYVKLDCFLFLRD